VLWVAAASSTTAPFIPWHIGATEVPVEFQRHRYLTEGEAEAFQDPERQGLESTKYAFRVFKRLFYLTKEHPEEFQPEVMETFTAFEAGLIADQLAVEKTALTLFNAGENDLARKYLTEYSSGKALDGLRLGETLAESLEARTKALYRIRRPRPTP
jgi:dipeptidase